MQVRCTFGEWQKRNWTTLNVYVMTEDFEISYFERGDFTETICIKKKLLSAPVTTPPGGSLEPSSTWQMNGLS